MFFPSCKNLHCLLYTTLLIFPYLQPTAANPLHPVLRSLTLYPDADAPTLHSRADVPTDVSAWAAFGDSYASGIGAGTNVGPGQVFSASYPQQMNNNDPRIGTAPNRDFRDLAFSGYRTPQVIAVVPKMGTPEVVTLQIGGNDAGFYNVMTACVYHFGAGSSGDCNTELQDFQDNLDNVVPGAMDQTIKAITDQGGTGLAKLIVIGYTAPYNQDTTQCDDVTFQFWPGEKHPAYLTQNVRAEINSKITNLNTVIEAAAQRANGANGGATDVVFVDYSVAWNGHRFCEDGVVEPAKNRENTWFFNLPDYDDEDLDDLEGKDIMNGLPDPSTCSAAAQLSGDWGDLALCDIAMAIAADINLVSTLGSLFGGPEYGRIGHPKPIGHLSIADGAFTAMGHTAQRGGFASGWCGFHITQWQKLNPNDPSSHYRIDITIKDANGMIVATAGMLDAPSGFVNSLQGTRLPLPLTVVAQNVDKDALLFTYGDQNFGSNDQPHHCEYFYLSDHGYDRVR